jgi:5-methyltetrahydrofolate--homocysteine methyltransferase
VGKLAEGIVALDKEAALAAVEAGLAAGRDPLELVDEAREGLEEVGEKFDCGDFFLMELMRAAQIFQAAAEILNPAIQEAYGGVETVGVVLLGTVAGDIHDLGKNIVKILLECRGMEVVDLGVDVPVEEFVERVREVEPDVVGLSALLTASIPQMRATIEALEAAGLREGRKVIVGGGIVGEVSLAEVNADHATVDANKGVRMIARWIASTD